MKKATASKAKSKQSSLLQKLGTIKPSNKLFIVIFALVAVYMISKVFAATGQLYITPAATSIQQNETFTVSVRITPDTPIDGVEASVAYDPASIEFVSIDASASPFTADLQTVTNSGSIQLTRGILGSTVSNDSLIANITFKALKPTASTLIDVSGNATYVGVYTDPTYVSATVAIIDPNPPAPVGDTTPPVVTIVTPLEGARPVKGKITVEANATDSGGTVTKMEVYVDGSIMQTSTFEYITYAWPTKSRKIPNGTHVITVKAYDTTGNVGTATVNVTK